ncbi:hypothetical protein K438DRAFT_1767662 [Mycena galopus ATCC 62051]|nr:hypothetical protein K438DRAFT_1767662 [Mycena galopus ATCC 62051]
MVNLTAMALAGTLFSMIDFQGHALDNLFGQDNDRNVVIGENMLDPVEVQIDQVTYSTLRKLITGFTQWTLVATNTSSQFTIMNPFANKSLSYAGQLEQLTHAQVTIDSIPRAFNFVLAAPPQTFNILDVNTGLALTSWNMSSFRVGAIAGSSTPVLWPPSRPPDTDIPVIL